MKLFKVIDYLFVGIRYLCWGIGVIGIIASLILIVSNLGLGLAACLLFVSTLLVSIAVTLLLAPSFLLANRLSNKMKYSISAACLIIALVVTGIIYFTNGGFPAINLLFI